MELLNNKLASIMILGCVSALSCGYANADNSVHFTGTVVASPCTVVVNGGSSNVDLGQTTVTYMTKGATTHPVNFSIDLNSCSTSTFTDAEFTFYGDADSDDPTALKNAGDAQGVGVQMKDSANAIIPIGSAVGQKLVLPTVADGSASANFTAYMIGTKGTATAGSVDVTSTFGIKYN